MIKNIFFLPFRLVIYLLSSLIPKKKNLWIFGSWSGKAYSDNPKAFSEYIDNLDCKIINIWILKDKNIVRELNKRKVRAYYCYSLYGIYLQMRSEATFYTHMLSSEFEACVIGYSTKCYLLYHGVVLKKVGRDYKVHLAKKNKLMKLAILIYNKMDIVNSDSRISAAICCSDYDSKIMRSAFNLKKEKVLNVGYPRNDNLIRNDSNDRLIYMPTFRGVPYSDFTMFDDYNFSLSELDDVLERNNLYLDIKLHPVQKISERVARVIRNSSRLNLLQDFDVYSELGAYKGLLTDYSSIIFDYALTDGDLLILTSFDLDSYSNDDRGMYLDYQSTFSDYICNDWPAVIERIRDYGRNKTVDLSALRSDYHLYTAGSSSERLYNIINKDLNG